MMAIIIVLNYNNIIVVNNNNYNLSSVLFTEVYCQSDHEISAGNFTEDRMCPPYPKCALKL